MPKEKILIVEDEEDILELVKYNLNKEGYVVTGVTSGEDALKSASTKHPDLIILDLMLPGIDGYEVCRELKSNSKTAHIPVVMLTAKGEDSDIVTGLELGADDYVTKPFSPKVLIARVRSVLRRKRKTETDEKSVIKIHNLVINPIRFEVLLGNKKVDLTATEFALLHFLARRPGWVFTRPQLLNGIKGDNYALTDRSIDVQVVGLRKKLKTAGNYIETVRGVGYRFKE